MPHLPFEHCRKTHICRSATGFAECQNTGTRQSASLPSAQGTTLGKHPALGTPNLCQVPAVGKEGALGIFYLCRVPLGLHSAKGAHVPSTHARCASAVRVADGVKPMPSSSIWHLAKLKLYRVPTSGTRQSIFRRVPSLQHSANLLKNSFFGPSNFFILYLNLRI